MVLSYLRHDPQDHSDGRGDGVVTEDVDGQTADGVPTDSFSPKASSFGSSGSPSRKPPRRGPNTGGTKLASEIRTALTETRPSAGPLMSAAVVCARPFIRGTAVRAELAGVSVCRVCGWSLP
jgi:hypothetical protein